MYSCPFSCSSQNMDSIPHLNCGMRLGCLGGGAGVPVSQRGGALLKFAQSSISMLLALDLGVEGFAILLASLFLGISAAERVLDMVPGEVSLCFRYPREPIGSRGISETLSFALCVGGRCWFSFINFLRVSICDKSSQRCDR
jgi:hypothetical protein